MVTVFEFGGDEMNLDRRSFIRGMLVSATAGTAMIQLATAEETKLLTTGPVALGNIEPEVMPPPFSSPEVYIRHNGVFLCVGIIREIKTTVGVTDMVSWEGQVTMVPGLKRSEMWSSGER